MSQHSTLVSENGLFTADITVGDSGSLLVKIDGVEYYINLTPV